jgi:hypothetical protein
MQLRNLVLLTLPAWPLCAQPWDFLGKFGSPMQPAFDSRLMQPGVRDDTVRRTLGFGVLVPLKGPAAIEVNSMWRSARLDFQRVEDTPLKAIRYQVFDIPMLARITVHERNRAQVFASGGYVLRTMLVTNEVPTAATASQRYWYHGGAVGGGISIGFGWVRLEPEYRFTALRGGHFLRNSHDLLIGLRLAGLRR